MTSADLLLLLGPVVIAIPVYLKMFFDRADKRSADAAVAAAKAAAAAAAKGVEDAKQFAELVRHAVVESSNAQRREIAAQTGTLSQIETLVNSASTVAAETIAGQAALIARLLPDDIAAQESWRRAVRALDANKRAQAAAAEVKHATDVAAQAKATLDEDVARAQLAAQARTHAAIVLPDATPVVLPPGTNVVPPTTPPAPEPDSTA